MIQSEDGNASTFSRTTHRRSVSSGHGSALLLLFASTCGASDDVELVASGLAALPDTYTDPNGMQWIKQQTFERLEDSPIVPPDNSEPENDETEASALDKLSVEEAAEKLRPVVLMGNTEYILDEADSIEFARMVQDALRDEAAGKPIETPVVKPEGVEFESVELQDRFPRDVFSPEERGNTNVFAHNFPWNMIAAMQEANSFGVKCTAFKLLNNFTAVTAAHCVHNGSNFKAMRDIRFAAGSPTQSKPPLPALSPLTNPASPCYSVAVPGGWDGDDAAFDWAVIRFRGRGEFCNFNDFNVGAFGTTTVSGCTVNIAGQLAGYPAKNQPDAPPGSWSDPSLFNHFRTDGWTSCGTYPSALWYYNDTSGGQSGSPFFSTPAQVRAIHKGGWQGAFDHSNRGRKMDSGLISAMQALAGF